MEHLLAEAHSMKTHLSQVRTSTHICIGDACVLTLLFGSSWQVQHELKIVSLQQQVRADNAEALNAWTAYHQVLSVIMEPSSLVLIQKQCLSLMHFFLFYFSIVTRHCMMKQRRSCNNSIATYKMWSKCGRTSPSSMER